MALPDRIAGRKAAEVIADLAALEAASLVADGPNSLWSNLVRLAGLRLPAQPPSKLEPMDDEEALAWGKRTTFSYGAHAGQAVIDIPISYLVFIVDDDEFKKQLRRYLGCPRIQREINEDLGD